MSGTLVIWSLSRLDNGTRKPCPNGFDLSAGFSRTVSGMGHWKRMIKISGGTDCYYCINDMTCLIHVCYLVTVPDNLSDIILPVYLLLYLVHVTLSMSRNSALHISSSICIPCSLCSTPYYSYIAYAHMHVHCYHITTNMFISITSPLDNSIYFLNWIRL